MFHGGLFADDAAKARANGCAEEWRRYAFGLAIVESKQLDASARQPVGRAAGTHRALNADAPLSAPRGRSDQRRAMAPLLRRRPIGLGGGMCCNVEGRT